jgi:hypothetical protein
VGGAAKLLGRTTWPRLTPGLSRFASKFHCVPPGEKMMPQKTWGSLFQKFTVHCFVNGNYFMVEASVQFKK